MTRLILVTILVTFLPGCLVTQDPDGTKSYAPDYNAWLKITELILADEVPPVAIPVNESK